MTCILSSRRTEQFCQESTFFNPWNTEAFICFFFVNANMSYLLLHFFFSLAMDEHFLPENWVTVLEKRKIKRVEEIKLQ